MIHAKTTRRAEPAPALHAIPPLAVELHGVSLELQALEADFMAYAVRTLTSLMPVRPCAPQIVARLEWVDAPATRDLHSEFRAADWNYRWDRDLYVGNGGAYWLRIDDFLDLNMHVSWEAERLTVVGRYHFQVGRNPKWERLRRWRRRSELHRLRARRFSTLLYYLVYHPLLWWLSRFEGWHVLHAAAVRHDGRAHVLAGLPGCGKSTLAVGALAVPGFEMMSDNLLLTDGTNVRACPEELLLDADSALRIGQATRHLMKTGDRRAYARDTYGCDRTSLEAIPPQAIHIVGRGRQAATRRIEPGLASMRIEAANALAKEVRRCRMMGHVLDVVAGTRPPDERRVIDSLTSKTRCFETLISEGENLALFARHRLATVS